VKESSTRCYLKRYEEQQDNKRFRIFVDFSTRPIFLKKIYGCRTYSLNVECSDLILTRMLAINAAIPNLMVDRACAVSILAVLLFVTGYDN